MALDDARREDAVRRIGRAWRSFRDRRVFAYLRHAVCRAEDSLTHQVLRKISPIEAFILRDPTLHARLRFRFGGSSFPPVILYKIFVNANVQYVAGTTQILAGSKAAEDACDRMGERKYFDIVLSDIENCTPLADSRLVQVCISLSLSLFLSLSLSLSLSPSTAISPRSASAGAGAEP